MSEMGLIKTKLKKNDNVVVIAGKEKGKTGRILKIDRVKGRVLIEGVNFVKKAVKRKNEQDRGGIIEIEASIAISNVMFADRSGKPTRLTYKIDGDKKTRVSVKTGEVLS